MIYWLRYYKNAVMAVVWLALLAAGGVVLFGTCWREYGIAAGDGASVSPLIWQGDEPALETHNRRVARGARVTVRELASARPDGSKVVLRDGQGNETDGVIDTGKPGIYSYVAIAKNPENGREVRKNVWLLVDGGKVY